MFCHNIRNRRHMVCFIVNSIGISQWNYECIPIHQHSLVLQWHECAMGFQGRDGSVQVGIISQYQERLHSPWRPWRSMWEVQQHFLVSQENKSFPNMSNLCPLQPYRRMFLKTGGPLCKIQFWIFQFLIFLTLVVCLLYAISWFDQFWTDQ